MKNVLESGCIGSNKKRREEDKKPIPTSFFRFKLNPPGAHADFVDVKNIKSIGCVTYIIKLTRRIRPTDTGFYVNVLPWIPWRK